MKVLILALFAGIAVADNRPASYAPAYNYPDTDPAYTFNYNVYNNDNYEPQNFNQQENRDGYNTRGSYQVLLPDGRTQIVDYRVEGDSGFIADVRYEGVAQAYNPKPKATYKPAPVAYKPAPVAYKPAPVVYKPAPVVYKPAPVVYKPAPVVYKPAPVVYKPAPTYAPAPKPTPTYAPAPKPVTTYAPAPAPVKPAQPAREYGPVKFNPFG